MAPGRRRWRRALLVLLVATAAVPGCSDARPAASAADPQALRQSDQLAAGAVEQALLTVEPPPLDLAVAPAPLPGSAPARAPHSLRAPDPAAETPAAPPAGPHLPLDALLRCSVSSGPPPERPLDLEALLEEPAQSPLPESIEPVERWKERVRLRNRSEPIGRAGARQGTHSETEASLRIPVDDAVSLEGGVRVDSRHDPDAEAPERKSIPRVGVEVRF
jgi:hypothetical protein